MGLVLSYVQQQIRQYKETTRPSMAKVVFSSNWSNPIEKLIQDVPSYIPAKYRSRVLKVLLLALLNTLNQKADCPLELERRQAFLEKAWDVVKSKKR